MSKKSKSHPLLMLGAAALVGVLLAFSDVATREVRAALGICATMLIPSLFPLTVASELATRLGAVEALVRPMGRPLSKILGISREAVAAYFLGMVGGYTAACRSAVLLYEGGRISRADCESVVALSNLPSVGFVVGFVGSGAFGDARIGWRLWGIAVASTLILGAVNKFLTKRGEKKPLVATRGGGERAAVALVRAISGGAEAMLLICGCVVFFSAVSGILAEALPIREAELLLSPLEITRGALAAAEVGGRGGAMICAANIGFSGVCVHCQVVALTESAGIGYRKYFALKLAQGAICAALAALAFPK